jgi:hypothetical protein
MQLCNRCDGKAPHIFNLGTSWSSVVTSYANYVCEFCIILRINMIISLNVINQIIFEIEKHCVFFVVGNEFLSIC